LGQKVEAMSGLDDQNELGEASRTGKTHSVVRFGSDLQAASYRNGKDFEN